jgi:hypothetical protein
VNPSLGARALPSLAMHGPERVPRLCLSDNMRADTGQALSIVDMRCG